MFSSVTGYGIMRAEIADVTKHKNLTTTARIVERERKKNRPD